MIKRILFIACIYLVITCAPWMIQAIMDMTFTQFFIVVLTLSVMILIGAIWIAVAQDRYFKKMKAGHEERIQEYEHIFSNN